MKPIVVAGSINVDFVAEAIHLPRPGETVPGRRFETNNGGKGANQAYGIARLGRAVSLIGMVGEDPFGTILSHDLELAGIDCRGVEAVRGSTGVAFITRDALGENSIVVIPGANQFLTAERMRQHATTIRGASMLLLQLETPLDGVAEAIAISRENGVPVMLDPAPAFPLDSSLLAGVDWLTPNETETNLLLGLPADFGSLDPAAAARQLLDRGPKNVALKLGPRGVFLAGESTAPVLVPSIAVQSVDTTAAGDMFNAAFAAKLTEGCEPVHAAAFATAAASLSVTRPGAQTSMPLLEEVTAWILRHQADYAGDNSLGNFLHDRTEGTPYA